MPCRIWKWQEDFLQHSSNSLRDFGLLKLVLPSLKQQYLVLSISYLSSKLTSQFVKFPFFSFPIEPLYGYFRQIKIMTIAIDEMTVLEI